jgi:hypothetical protein
LRQVGREDFGEQGHEKREEANGLDENGFMLPLVANGLGGASRRKRHLARYTRYPFNL